MKSIPSVGLRSKRISFRLSLVFLVAFFIVVNAGMSLSFGAKFDSPDETANYTFIRRLATTGTLAIPEPLLAVNPYVYPRSFAAHNGAVVSGSFVGMIFYYGAVAALVGPWVVPWLTSLFAALAIVAFFQLVSRIFGREYASLATVLLLVHPAFWYYTSRGMYHNALFVDLLVIGCWAICASVDFRRETASQNRDRRAGDWWRYAVAGLAVGGALAVRTSEAPWVMLVLAGMVMALRRRIDFRKKFWLAVAMAAAAMAPVFVVNAALFGQALSFVYTPETIGTSSVTAIASGVWSKIALVIFPFGLRLDLAWKNFWDYGLGLFWWLSLPTVLGVAVIAWRTGIAGARRLARWFDDSAAGASSRVDPALAVYLGMYVMMAMWLLLSYGSQAIHDNPDPSAITIGNSYVRYWLPLYVFGVPFAAMGLRQFANYVRQHVSPRFASLLLGATVIGLVVLGVMTTVFNKDEGLAITRQHAIEYQRLADLVADRTSKDAVIIAGRADKAVYPERPVISAVDGVRPIHALRTMSVQMPVYLYVGQVESPRTVRSQWQQKGFAIGPEQINLRDHEYLFRVSPYETVN